LSVGLVPTNALALTGLAFRVVAKPEKWALVRISAVRA